MNRYLIFFLSFMFLISINASTSPYSTADDESGIFDIDDSLLIAAYPDAGVKPTHRRIYNRTFSHVLHTRITPKFSLTPEYLIIAEKNLFFKLTKEIKTYAEDVHAVTGYGIFLEYVENPTPESIKSLIVSYQNNLCGAFLIGNMGECLFETQNDHGEYGYRKWPCDLFYMDLDGDWTDSDGNGVYDTHTGNVAPEIFVGRLSTAGLSSYGNEEYLIRRQLQKSHDFWWKTSYHAQDTTLNYINGDWANLFHPYTISKVFSTLAITDVHYGIDPGFSSSDYLSKLSSDTYGFTHLAAHSSPILHHFTNENYYIRCNHIKNINSSNYAYSLFCCSACNWTAGDSSGYLGGAYLFNEGKTIAIIGTTKTGGMRSNTTPDFYSMLPYMNLGNAFLNWWSSFENNHTNDTIYWFYGMALLGDPIINFRYKVSDRCVNNLSLTTFPYDNVSNLILYKAGNKITVSGSFVIPQGVHVIFDAPQVVFEPTFTCPVGASFETRNEGCEL